MILPHRRVRTIRVALLAGIATMAVVSSTVAAQAPITPMTPSAPYEALAFFEGAWTLEERTVEQALVETCAWLPAGRRHMVCRTLWRGTSGAREGWSILSYRAADSTYLYYGLRAGGTVEPMQGRLLADGWELLRRRAPVRGGSECVSSSRAWHRNGFA